MNASNRPVTVDRLAEFDVLIDARSPSEFAEDHLPGAINCPVLDDEERRIVGTLYKQQGAFEAKRVGGAMVARNLARHLDADPESTLRAANRKFERRFASIENALAAHGKTLAQSTLAEMDALWDAAKAAEK